ncbi:hypothetical protein A9Y87_15190 [Salmonella enterica subsp. enterica]|nr:hypothetical protein A9Y87_15190 [Salmonella enterica subsp. enterica]
MLDPNLLRNEPDAVAEKLARRGFKLDVDKLRALEERRKVLQVNNQRRSLIDRVSFYYSISTG